MAITKQSRLQIFQQFKKSGAAQADIEYLEKALDDSNPLGNQFEQMFAARAEMSRSLNDADQEKQRLANERAAINAWKTQQEQNIAAMNAEAQRKIAEAATMAKIAVDRLNGAVTKARAGEELTLNDLQVDASLNAFASTAGNGSLQQSLQQPQTSPANNFSQPQYQQQQPAQQQQPVMSAEQFANNLIKEIGTLEGIKYQHQQLYGQPLDAQTLINMAQTQQRPLMELYNEIYTPDTKRAEIARIEFDAKVQEAVDAKVKELSLAVDPSGQSNSLAMFGAMENKNRSAALQNLGPNNTAMQLDPGFAARMGQNAFNPQLPMQQQQQQGMESAQGQAMGQLQPAQQSNSLGDMDSFIADMMAGIQSGRTQKAGTEVLR